MKTLIAASLLFALVVPASATEAMDLRKWEDLNSGCHHGVFPDDEDVDVHSTQKEYDRTARGKVCLAARKLEKQLTAKGYCVPSREETHYIGPCR